MKNDRLVSICIPTIDRVEYLKACIESVRRQDHPRLEIIVSDNGSTDGTREYLAGLAARSIVKVHLQAENVGMVGNWNAALALATGERVMLLSDDDLLQPGCVSRLLAAASDPAVAFVYSTVRFIDSAGQVFGASHAGPPAETTAAFVEATWQQRRSPYPSALLFRLEAARSIKGFQPIGNQSDVAFRVALAEEAGPRARVLCESEPLVDYRVHGGALTTNAVASRAGRIGLLGWWAARYRGDSLQHRRAVFSLLDLAKRFDSDEIRTELKRAMAFTAVDGFRRRVAWLAGTGHLPRWAVLLSFPRLAMGHVAKYFFGRLFQR